MLRSHSGQQQEIGYAGQPEHHTVPICSQWAAACLKPSPEDITNELREDCGHLKHYIWEKELIKYALVWALKLIFCLSYVISVCSIMQTSRLRCVWGSVLLQMSVIISAPSQQYMLHDINGKVKTAGVYFIYEVCIIDEVIFTVMQCWQRNCCILHDCSPWHCIRSLVVEIPFFKWDGGSLMTLAVAFGTETFGNRSICPKHFWEQVVFWM